MYKPLSVCLLAAATSFGTFSPNASAAEPAVIKQAQETRVTGKLVLPKTYQDKKVDLSKGKLRLSVYAQGVNYPNGYRRWSSDQKEKWLNSPEGAAARAFEVVKANYQKRSHAINAKGEFSLTVDPKYKYRLSYGLPLRAAHNPDLVETNIEFRQTLDLSGKKAGLALGEIKLTAKPVQRKGNKLFHLDFPKLYGKGNIDSREYLGKFLVVDQWATWCFPCKQETPHLKQAYKEFKDQGLEILLISYDMEPKNAIAYAKKNEITHWPHAYAGFKGSALPKDSKLHGWITYAWPTIYLVGPDGVIVNTNFRGKNNTRILESAIKMYQSKGWKYVDGRWSKSLDL